MLLVVLTLTCLYLCHVSCRLHRMVRQIFELHSFTAEGALQLEKDVRTVLLGFTELTPDRIPTHKGNVSKRPQMVDHNPTCSHRPKTEQPTSLHTISLVASASNSMHLYRCLVVTQGVRASLGRLSNIAAIVTISSCEDLQDYDLLLPPTESSVNARRLSQPEAARLLKVNNTHAKTKKTKKPTPRDPQTPGLLLAACCLLLAELF